LLYIAPGRVALVRHGEAAELKQVGDGHEIAAAHELVECATCSSVDVLWGAGIVTVHRVARVDGVFSAEERAKIARAVIVNARASLTSLDESLIDVVAPTAESDWIAYLLPRSYAEALSKALPSTRVRSSGALCAEVFASFELATPAPHLVGVLEGAMLSWVGKTRRAILAPGQARVGANIGAARSELRRQALRLGISEGATLLCDVTDGANRAQSLRPAAWRGRAPAPVRALTREPQA
jgi:hypothetical protein